jgi:hypothetical protein
VSLYIGAVIEGAVHFKAIIVLRPKIFYIPQHHALAIPTTELLCANTRSRLCFLSFLFRFSCSLLNIAFLESKIS